MCPDIIETRNNHAASKHPMAHAGRRSPLDPGEASPSFAQTGAEFRLDDSDDEAVIDEFDLRHEAARGVEAYEMVERDTVRRRMSASTVASFQLYTPDEDLAVRTKFDRKLVLFVALLYLLSFLDRSSTLPCPTQFAYAS